MRKLIVILTVVLLLVSCASKGPKRIDSAGNLYIDGVNFLKAKKYSKAIEKFNTLRENHPFDSLAIVAAVKLGDTYFAQKEYVMATSVYEDFFRAHPEDENAPYVLSRLGECYEKESLTIDRDQAYTLKGIERLTYLKNRYPNSPYAKESEQRLSNLIERLAARELYIGEFYYRSSQYNACIIRLEYFLLKYPQAKGRDKALLYLSLSYRELGNQEKSDMYLSRLQAEFPKSTYSRTTIRERKTLQTAKPGVPETNNQATKTAPTNASTAAAGRPADVPKPAPAAPVYEEYKPRNIELRPPSQVTGAQQQTQQTTVQPIASAPTPEKPANSATGSQTPAKEAVKDNADTSKKNNSGSKDSGLGFFDKKKPVDIVSDSMEGFDKEKYVLFKGSVIAKQEDLFIFADTLEAYMNESTNEIEKAVAKGNVKIVKQDRTATCREATFENAKGEITLKDNVVVYQGKDKLSGDTIIYYVNEDRVVVQSEKNSKARITVQPKN
ncbi:MAG TPA: lipopolysaccharide transport periplasmic protein LptA [Syntrophorhabdaceae bacterium]|nr:lipopolysaccharide transport periplasmic protein LptA [Syntrophorhabdaceae bacterium]